MMYSKKILLLFLAFPTFAISDFYYKGNQLIYLQKVSRTPTALLSTQHYKTPTGEMIALADEIIVKVTNRVFLDALALKYDFDIIEEIVPHSYLIRVKDSLDTLEISNNLHLEYGVIYSEPNFIKTLKKR